MSDSESIRPVEQYNLGRLQFWLEIEIASGLLMFFAFFYIIFFYVLGALALLFTPYMVKVLAEEKRFGWIMLLIGVVYLPALFIYLYLGDHQYFQIWLLIPLFTFYTYCGVLRLVLPEWLK